MRFLRFQSLYIVLKINDLDKEKGWVDWVGRYGSTIVESFNKPSYEFIKGFVKEILVSPNFGKNRDDVEKQIGFTLEVKFSQPIVDDSIEYINPKNKSKGYNSVKGKRNKNIGSIEVNVGGRGKNSRIRNKFAGFKYLLKLTNEKYL